MLLVSHDWLSQQIRQRREIVTIAIEELALSRVGHRHADIALAESLRLVLPSADAFQIVGGKPQLASGRIRINAGSHSFAIYNVDRHR